MSSSVPRRRLLGLAAAAVGTAGLGGCRVRPEAASRSARSPAASVSAQPSTVQLPVVSFGPLRLPHVVEGFEHRYPGIKLVQTMPGAKPFWVQMLDAPLVATFYQFAPLDSDLRALNFNPALLLPGSVEPYVRKGQTLALPFSEIPWAVRWRTDAFAAAALQPPRPDWGFADFRNACAALQALSASGRLRGLHGALAPVVTGTPAIPAGGHPAHAGPVYVGALSYPGLWQAFVWGFGGSLVANGQFHLTDPATVRGLSALVELTRDFAVSPADALAGSYAMALSLYQPGGLAANWKWARLPRFPVDPVIPTVSVAQGLATTDHPKPPAADLVTATAQYLLWFYTAEATALLVAAGTPPALAGAAVQTEYWARRQGDGAVGDWRNFRDCYAGFPFIPFATMYSAIDQVLAGAVDLRSALATAEQAMNAHRDRQEKGFTFALPYIGQ